MRNLNLSGLREAVTNTTITIRNKIIGSLSSTTAFLFVRGTLPSAGFPRGVQFEITSSGTLNNQQAFVSYLKAGFTGAGNTTAGYFQNDAAGTGASVNGNQNCAVHGNQLSIASGYGVGIKGISGGSTAANIGVSGTGDSTGSAADGIGGYFIGVSGTGKSVGVFGYLGGLTAPLPGVNTAGLFDNSTTSFPIIIARENGSPVFTIDTLGNIKLSRTITAAGTTGAQTINKPAGTVNFAAGAGSLVLTNSLITASSIVLLTIRTNDATMKSAIAVCAAGSCTITPNAAPTAETSVGFLVTN